MNREKKLHNIMSLLDYIVKLDESFWINVTVIRKLYFKLSEIEDETNFDQAYRLILAEISWIFNKLEKLDKEIDKIYIKTDEKINNASEKKELIDIEKQFNF